MKLTFLGGADEVGASATLIEIGGKRLLVDAGIRIRPRTARGLQDSQLPDLRAINEAGGVDYIIATHAHTDHTGALPLVVEQYPVPVLATPPTISLVKTLQADAQRIMQSKQEVDGELPLFDEISVDRLLEMFQPTEFRNTVRLGEGLALTFYPAGHILGAAIALLESEEGVLAMSGDVSMGTQRAVIGAEPPNIKVDALVMESTYGGKLHANRVTEEKRLIEMLQQVTDNGGRVLIPAFAIGRAQEILQIILAHRDKISAPVYVDGMVRSVCRTFSAHADYLPPETPELAGEDSLFFRKKIKAIRSGGEREHVARSEEPAIVVASSGMLTGGASVVYARHLASDERSAILLTGYQDAESPGRFLQNVQRKRQEQGEVSFDLDGKTTTLRCAIDTYSLSAHADEGQLVSLAEALGADDVFLVHGDPGARHSVGAGLRERGKRVRTPNAGQTHTVAYASRLVAVGKVKGGGRVEALDPAALWEMLKAQAGSYFTAGELARMWWGDEDRAAEAMTVLVDSVYFAQDWRHQETFQVRTDAQVERAARRRAVMAAHPNLIGQIVVLRDSNNRPRVGRVMGAGADAFEAIVRGAKGRHYPGDALLWPIGMPQNPAKSDKAVKAQLNALFRTVEDAVPKLISFDRREALVQMGKPVDPATLLPKTLPEGITPLVALLAVTWALAEDGATLDLDAGGLLPKRVMREGAMEMNQARETILAAFPAEARLSKVGMEVHRKRITLSFDFPGPATKRYAEMFKQLEDQTGWDIRANPRVNQQSLGAAVEELLPEGVWINKGPSYHLDRGQVHVKLDGKVDAEALKLAYYELTGFHLIVEGHGSKAESEALQAAVPGGGRAKMEINQAYAVIKLALEPFGLYKTSLKQGQIALTFISPQVAARHAESIARLAEETGYILTVHPHPNQQKIMQIVSLLIRDAGWRVAKGPGLHVDRAEISLKLVDDPDAAQLQEVSAAIEEQTGYKLMVGVQ